MQLGLSVGNGRNKELQEATACISSGININYHCCQMKDVPTDHTEICLTLYTDYQLQVTMSPPPSF